MRKTFTLIVIMFLMVGTLFAQTNRMSYQAVVRNANNELVYNENVSVQVEILNASGVVQYAERHTTSTNANGMLSLTIGDGTHVEGTFANVVWQNAVIRSVFTLADGSTVTQTTPVTAVPYAMYAENAGNAFSGDYNDLENRPPIPTVPEDVSAFNNDAGYITAADIPAENDPTVPAWAKESTKPTYDYSEIENTPQIPQVPENVSVFNNDAGYITAADIPAIPTVPVDVSAFNNDAGYVSNALCDTVDICSLMAIINQLQARISELEDKINTEDTTTTDPVQPTTADGQPCPNAPTVTDHEGNVYNTIMIGEQCWTKENMRATTSPTTGTYIINTADNYTTTGKMAKWPNNDSVTAVSHDYGLLYNWYAAMDTFRFGYTETSVTPYANAPSGFLYNFTDNRRGICPKGWHVPSDAEWTLLATYIGNNDDLRCGNNQNNVAKAIASTNGWDNSSTSCAVGNGSNNNNATNFTAIPAGYFHQGGFMHLGSIAYFWSSTDAFIDGDAGKIRCLESSSVALGDFNYYFDHNNKPCGFSVRCLKDDPNSANPQNPGEGSGSSTTTTDGIPCPNNPTVTDVDGNVYNTVQIGEQCWMNENLKTTHYANGDTILLGNSRTYPNNDPTNVAEYGYLYNWYATMHLDNSYQGSILDIQGICPTGWHVPSYDEWGMLSNYAGQNHWGLIALTGFSTQLAGRYWDGYRNFGEKNYFWTRDYIVNQSVAYRCMDADMNLSSNGETENAHAGYSVRCLRD